MIYLLNTPILTAYGSYKFEPITVKKVRKLLQENEWRSAIGHDSTASMLSEILGMFVAKNRVAITMQKGDIAIVFKLKQRPPEGAILTKDELEKIGFEFAKLVKID